jgi:hypothetical protein
VGRAAGEEMTAAQIAVALKLTPEEIARILDELEMKL